MFLGLVKKLILLHSIGSTAWFFILVQKNPLLYEAINYSTKKDNNSPF